MMQMRMFFGQFTGHAGPKNLQDEINVWLQENSTEITIIQISQNQSGGECYVNHLVTIHYDIRE